MSNNLHDSSHSCYLPVLQTTLGLFSFQSLLINHLRPELIYNRIKVWLETVEYSTYNKWIDIKRSHEYGINEHLNHVKPWYLKSGMLLIRNSWHQGAKRGYTSVPGEYTHFLIKALICTWRLQMLETEISTFCQYKQRWNLVLDDPMQPISSWYPHDVDSGYHECKLSFDRDALHYTVKRLSNHTLTHTIRLN